MSDETNLLVMHGREFHLEEPPTSTVLAILNVIGSVAMRAESAAAKLVKTPTNRAVLFGLLAEMSEEDLTRLGVAVLQFEDKREGKKWLTSNGLKVAPLVEAFMINARLSSDLVESLRSFFGGIAGLEAVIVGLATSMTPTKEMDHPLRQQHRRPD